MVPTMCYNSILCDHCIFHCPSTMACTVMGGLMVCKQMYCVQRDQRWTLDEPGSSQVFMLNQLPWSPLHFYSCDRWLSGTIRWQKKLLGPQPSLNISALSTACISLLAVMIAYYIDPRTGTVLSSYHSLTPGNLTTISFRSNGRLVYWVWRGKESA
jgi:hypothetical protein